jgi:tetratricopeptide (TPR) repeat protein
MASDRVDLAVEGGPEAANPASPIKEAWQRWNDYGIGLLLEGSEKGGQKGELKQAEPVFRKVTDLGKVDGWVNLARVYIREGRIPDARDALAKAATHAEAPAPWVIHWLTGQVNDRNGLLDEAIASYEAVLATRVPERGLDFSQDYEVINALGASLYNRARRERAGSPEREKFVRSAIGAYRRTLAIDSENVAAHYGLGLAYSECSLEAKKEDSAPSKTDGDLDHIDDPKKFEELLRLATDAKAAVEKRLTLARRLYWNGIEPLMNLAEKPGYSRLEPLHEVVEVFGSACESESDPAVRSAQARALEAAHKAIHRMLKPDETAEGRAVAIARKNDPAADQNAQSVVIHPLQQPAARNGGEE